MEPSQQEQDYNFDYTCDSDTVGAHIHYVDSKGIPKESDLGVVFLFGLAGIMLSVTRDLLGLVTSDGADDGVFLAF